ncbi:polysaccharide pyruvyl transferase family protein [Dietzia sp. B44]|uniref:polysaccharide pyruvyl transferase family protein n=1 Tax=Dietzia sp. B44 TaxID=1630633 RepID=UPI0015FC876F|nr:polysaccharide pyruvyl transferase family protein [Dietzia sp. B44]
MDIAYLGWVRRGNLGDQAMYEAFHNLVSSTHSVQLAPITSVGRLIAAGSRPRTLVVGGGTLLGLPEWNFRIEEAIRMLKPDRVVSLGTGVVNPGTEIDSNRIEIALAESARILEGFERVTVRGPRSVATLSRYGIEAEGIGDLALLRSRITAASPHERSNSILVNLANNSRRPLSFESDQFQSLISALRELKVEGYAVRFFAMEDKDIDLMLESVGREFEIIPFVMGADDLAHLMAASSLVLSERLHGSILAASVGTPFVAMPYMDKVVDFAASVDCLDWVLPRNAEVDGVDVGQFIRGVLNSTERRECAHKVIQTRSTNLSRSVIEIVSGH